VGLVDKDGNNKMITIAYEVVEANTMNSWWWILNLLLNDLQNI